MNLLVVNSGGGWECDDGHFQDLIQVPDDLDLKELGRRWNKEGRHYPKRVPFSEFLLKEIGCKKVEYEVVEEFDAGYL